MSCFVGVLTIDLFQYFFRICSSGAWFYIRSRGQSFIEGLLESIKRWKNEFIWLNSSHFSYRNIFHLPCTIKDQKPDRTSDLAHYIDKISRLNVSMKKFLEAVLGKVGMSPHWIRMGFVPLLYVRGPCIIFIFMYLLFFLAYRLSSCFDFVVRWEPTAILIT